MCSRKGGLGHLAEQLAHLSDFELSAFFLRLPKQIEIGIVGAYGEFHPATPARGQALQGSSIFS